MSNLKPSGKGMTVFTGKEYREGLDLYYQTLLTRRSYEIWRRSHPAASVQLERDIPLYALRYIGRVIKDLSTKPPTSGSRQPRRRKTGD